MSLKRFLPIVLLLLLLGALIYIRQPKTDPQLSRTALVMDTLVEIRAYGDDQSVLDKAISAAFDEMTRLEQLLSSHIPESEISRLSSSWKPLSLSHETIELLKLGQQIAEQSHGAFDMGLGALIKLWDIQGDSPRIPTEQELLRALKGIGPQTLTIDGLEVKKQDSQIQIDLGGIAKGYVVDRSVDILRQYGITSAAVNAGGDIRLLGDKQGQPWQIGIQHPRKAEEILVTLPLKNCAVVTSGDYERFFERDGVRYHHIFDPASGKPARLCQSVTVIAAEAARADALATAAFVLGPQAGIKLLEELPGVDGLLVSAEGKIFKTSGLPE